MYYYFDLNPYLYMHFSLKNNYQNCCIKITVIKKRYHSVLKNNIVKSNIMCFFATVSCSY